MWSVLARDGNAMVASFVVLHESVVHWFPSLH
jgi:hypothetical protein